MIAMPVAVQTTRVSKKLEFMVTRPCSTGESVRAAAAAMGAEPRQVSLENTPRTIPFCRTMMKLPIAPTNTFPNAAGI